MDVFALRCNAAYGIPPFEMPNFNHTVLRAPALAPGAFTKLNKVVADELRGETCTALVPHISSYLSLRSGAQQGAWLGGSIRFLVRALIKCDSKVAREMVENAYKYNDDLHFADAVYDAVAQRLRRKGRD